MNTRKPLPFWLRAKIDKKKAAMSKLYASNQQGFIIVQWREANKSKWDEILQFVRALEGAKFRPASKDYSCTDSPENITKLEGMEFKCKEKEKQTPQKILPPPQWPLFEYDESRLLPGLRDYQKEGMRFLAWRGQRGGLISDPPGCGKTLQALGWMHYTEAYPVLIIVPATIKTQWGREITKWLGINHKYQILQGKTPCQLRPITTIINWDILNAWLPALLKVGFQLVIGDEVQAIGNTTAKRTKAFQKLSRQCPRGPVGLSGTPIRTRPEQFWPMLNLVSETIFPDLGKFRSRYCNPHHDGYGWNYSGAANLEELHSLAMRCMIRREKSILNLPPKIRDPIYLDTEGMAQYLLEEKEFLEKASLLTSGKISRKELDERLESLKRTAYRIKEVSIISWIKEQMESSDEPLLVFGWHQAVLEKLVLELKAYKPLLINGSVTGKARDKVVESFKAGKSKLLFGNIQAMGVGLDSLQHVCSRGAFVEFAHNPGDMEQAEDRLYRSGQDNSVIWSYLLATGTIDEKLMAKINSRSGIMNMLLDGKSLEETGDFLSCFH